MRPSELLTGAKPLVVCVSHGCSKKLTKRGEKKKTGWRFRGREQAATSAPGNRQLPRAAGDQLQRMAHAQPSLPASHLLSHRPNSPTPLSRHFRMMRLTFTQLSTRQEQEIYPARGLGWSRASTWARPHDDPVAQPPR